MQKLASLSSGLPARLVFNSVALVVMTAVFVGLPAIWLIRQQLDRQAWALLDQGNRTTQALFIDAQEGLDDLATLTAQRPTLLEMVEQGEPAEFQAYLKTLQDGADLDLIVVCGDDRHPVGQAGPNIPAGVCDLDEPHSFHLASDGFSPRGWLFASQSIPAAVPGRYVVVGQALDTEFTLELRDKTGLEHIFLVEDIFVASSVPEITRSQDLRVDVPDGDPKTLGLNFGQEHFILNGIPYYAASSDLDGDGLQSWVLLSIAGINDTQRQLTRTMVAGIFGVAFLGIVLGSVVSGQISRPLARLKEAALALSKGNLTSPINARTKLPEVALVSYALEDARVALQQSLAELRQEKEWVEHLLGSIVEGIITLDWQGRITFFSRGAERITGLPQEQIIGRPIDHILVPAEGDKRFSQQLPAPGQMNKIVMAAPDGRPLTLAVTSASLVPPEAGGGATALVLRDVSDEEALRRLLGDFLANIAHEFRTPLSALAVSTGLMLDQLPDLSQEDLKELILSIHLGVTNLRTLIDNLLQGASIETGRFRVYPKPVRLSEVLSEALATVQPLLDKHGQRLELSLPEELPLVAADPLRTAQVLVNLLSNAIKWGPENAPIDLTVEAQAHQVKVLVADRGPGIPKELQADLFRRFIHIESGSGRAEYGAGLGLSVVKAIVEAQDGQVGVMDRSGGGAIFWFTLPHADPLKEAKAVER